MFALAGLPKCLYLGWEKFYKKYPNSSGLIMLSDIVFDENQELAVFYCNHHRYSLAASGNIIFMKKVENKWKLLAYQLIWIS